MGDAKLLAICGFFALHCTPMIESFQMQQTVDKQVAAIIFKCLTEFGRFLFCAIEVDIDLTVLFIERKGQNIGRSVLLTVREIELVYFFLAHDRHAQFVCLAKHGVLHLRERPPREGGLCCVDERKCVAHVKKGTRSRVLSSSWLAATSLRLLEFAELHREFDFGSLFELVHRMLLDAQWRLVSRRVSDRANAAQYSRALDSLGEASQNAQTVLICTFLYLDIYHSFSILTHYRIFFK